MTKILVAFYSTYGHVYQMAQSVAEGAKAAGAEVDLKRFPEVISDDKLQAMGALEAQKAFQDVPELSAEDLEHYDGILFGFPTRYGQIPQQVAAVLDRTGGQWFGGKLIGKVGSVFTSTASQHGGSETTCLGFYTFLTHMGMLISGVPYSVKQLLQLDEMAGGSPYGAATIAGGDGSRQPSKIELEIAKEQGRVVAGYAAKLAAK